MTGFRLPDVDDELHDVPERLTGTVSFSIAGMPDALHMELNSRAHRYGMSLDQYVIAVLGHLAWRTPFAEDMQPWENWDPERTQSSVLKLSSVD